ncbi:MAG: glycine cleavage system aminomethyltransferase GcvT, partial [Candidatus Ranarchaeia archaeon]
MVEYKTTHLYDWHKKHASAMHEFAGYMMPIRYSGINEEHLAVRHAVGIFDVTHMGRFHFRGERAAEFANYMTTNDVGRLNENAAQYTLICNEKGGIIDDCIVYYRASDWIYIVVNAGNKVKDLAWFKKHAPKFGVTVEDVSDQVPNFAVQGPKAEATLQKLTDIDL